jgi:hypothetical protein
MTLSAPSWLPRSTTSIRLERSSTEQPRLEMASAAAARPQTGRRVSSGRASDVDANVESEALLIDA